MNAPRPCDRSKNDENVPTTDARSASLTPSSASSSSAGYMSDMPTANTIVPTTSPATVGHAAMIAMPSRDERQRERARVATARAGRAGARRRCGRRGSARRRAGRSRPTPMSRSSSTYSGTNAVNPASGISPRNSTVPGRDRGAVEAGASAPARDVARATSTVNEPERAPRATRARPTRANASV